MELVLGEICFLEEQLQATLRLIRESHEGMTNWVAQKEGSYQVIP